MRTTLDIDTELLRKAKKLAAERGLPLRRVVEECLAQGLATAAARPGPARPLRWHSHDGEPLRGLDFSDRDRLYEAMEGRD